jgi:hypothetical protein
MLYIVISAITKSITPTPALGHAVTEDSVYGPDSGAGDRAHKQRPAGDACLRVDAGRTVTALWRRNHLERDPCVDNRPQQDAGDAVRGMIIIKADPSEGYSVWREWLSHETER